MRIFLSACVLVTVFYLGALVAHFGHGDLGIDWQIWMGAAATLVAAYAGARYAFQINKQHEERRENEQKRLAGNRAVLALWRQLNTLNGVLKLNLNPHRGDPRRYFSVKAVRVLPSILPRLDIDSIAFLLDGKNPNLLGHLDKAQHMAFSAMDFLAERSRMHVEEVQPLIEEENRRRLAGNAPRRDEDILGERLFRRINDLTNKSFETFDESVSETRLQIDALSNELRMMFPKQNVIFLIPNDANDGNI